MLDEPGQVPVEGSDLARYQKAQEITVAWSLS
jgi:hypothetical protein